MKRVCLVISVWHGGGTEMAVINLAEELMALGYIVDILCLSKPTHPINSQSVNFHYVELTDKKSKSFSYMTLRALGKIYIAALRGVIYKHAYKLQRAEDVEIILAKIRELDDFDLIISNTVEANLLCIAAGLDNHYSCMHNAVDLEELAPDIKYIYQGEKILTVSEELKECILNAGTKPLTIQTIYNIFNFDKIRKRGNEYEVAEKDYIIFVGRLASQKQVHQLLDAYVNSKIKQKLLIIGDGILEDSIRELINSQGIQDRVLMKGYILNPYPYIKNAKALVLCSDTEGLPTVLIEALVLGTPVVSNDCLTGPLEILGDELAGFLSPAGDWTAFSRNLRKVIDSPPEIQEKHIAKFNKEVNLPKYVRLIERIN